MKVKVARALKKYFRKVIDQRFRGKARRQSPLTTLMQDWQDCLRERKMIEIKYVEEEGEGVEGQEGAFHQNV